MSFVKDLLGVFFLDKLIGGRDRGIHLGDGCGDNGSLLILIALIAIEKQVQEDKCKIEHLEKRYSPYGYGSCGCNEFAHYNNGNRYNNGCCHDSCCHNGCGGGFFPGQFR